MHQYTVRIRGSWMVKENRKKKRERAREKYARQGVTKWISDYRVWQPFLSPWVSWEHARALWTQAKPYTAFAGAKGTDMHLHTQISDNVDHFLPQNHCWINNFWTFVKSLIFFESLLNLFPLNCYTKYFSKSRKIGPCRPSHVRTIYSNCISESGQHLALMMIFSSRSIFRMCTRPAGHEGIVFRFYGWPAECNEGIIPGEQKQLMHEKLRGVPGQCHNLGIFSPIITWTERGGGTKEKTIALRGTKKIDLFS